VIGGQSVCLHGSQYLVSIKYNLIRFYTHGFAKSWVLCNKYRQSIDNLAKKRLSLNRKSLFVGIQLPNRHFYTRTAIQIKKGSKTGETR